MRQAFGRLRCAAKADGPLQTATSDTDVAQHGVVETRESAKIATHPNFAREAGCPTCDQLACALAPSEWQTACDPAYERGSEHVVLHQREMLCQADPVRRREPGLAGSTVQRHGCAHRQRIGLAFRPLGLSASRLGDTGSRLTRGI